MTWWLLIPNVEIDRYAKPIVLRQLIRPNKPNYSINGFYTKNDLVLHLNKLNVPDCLRPKKYRSRCLSKKVKSSPSLLEHAGTTEKPEGI